MEQEQLHRLPHSIHAVTIVMNIMTVNRDSMRITVSRNIQRIIPMMAMEMKAISVLLTRMNSQVPLIV